MGGGEDTFDRGLFGRSPPDILPQKNLLAQHLIASSINSENTLIMT